MKELRVIKRLAPQLEKNPSKKHVWRQDNYFSFIPALQERNDYHEILDKCFNVKSVIF